MKIPFYKADILLPKKCDMKKWSVVACDQYTSEPDYWNEVKKNVGNYPSTLNLIFPEIYLENDDFDSRINNINENMNNLINDGFFKEYKNSLIYVERTQSDGNVREGIIGVVDLEEYSFDSSHKRMIRATEKIVEERIGTRVKIRESASLELPHVMLLIDDKDKKIIENLKYEKENKILYDFDLMQDSGHIKGYLLSSKTSNNVIKQLEELLNPKVLESKYGIKDPLLFAVGDGNHSLVAAKKCYENLKRKMGDEALTNKARYALVEVVNLYSESLKFESINRVLFDVDPKNVLEELEKYYDISYKKCDGQKIKYITKNKEGYLWIKNPKSNIAVGSIQIFIDDYLKTNRGKLDYVHGDSITHNLGRKDGNIGFIFEPIGKEKLFRTIMLDGILPRKTFSVGSSKDKRFYLESRKIK